MIAKQKRKNLNDIVLTIACVVISLLALALIIYGCIRPKNTTELLSRYSNADHGDTIEEFAMQTRDEEYEFIAIFNTKGDKLIEYTINNPGMSALPPEAEQYLYSYKQQDLIIAHNHPGEDHTFSDADMLLTHNESPYVAQLVFGYSHAYILQPDDQGWPAYNESWDYLNNVYLRFLNGDDGIADQITTDVTGAPLYTTDAFARCYAESFNLSYNVIDLDNFKLTDWVP